MTTLGIAALFVLLGVAIGTYITGRIMQKKNKQPKVARVFSIIAMICFSVFVASVLGVSIAGLVG